MNIPRFFSPFPLSAGKRVDLSESAARHAIRVLRLKVGDGVTLFDGRGGEYACSIAMAGRDAALADVVEWRASECESPVDVTLVQALQAGDKMDLTVQKAVELGVNRVAPVAARRSVLRLEGERARKRVAHWRGIAASACEQCGRNRVPEIGEIEELRRWLGRPADAPATLKLLLDPGAAFSLDALPRPEKDVRVELLIGAEGGLAPDEIDLALSAGFVAVRLGPRVLRTETAGLAALAAIQCLWGDFRSDLSGGRGKGSDDV